MNGLRSVEDTDDSHPHLALGMQNHISLDQILYCNLLRVVRIHATSISRSTLKARNFSRSGVTSNR
ncbi:hypothetical protein D2E46_12450 [Mycobacteroides abscessus]|nr:hypothetical protein D2E46_12450 [Mycobacteroides abscessus]